MIDYSNVRAVCFDCARKAGFTPKKKAVGVWFGKCEICLMQKPCTDLWHDWIPSAKKGRSAGTERPKFTPKQFG